MVLKKSKFGGNTGNTLRRSYRKGACKVSNDASFITKSDKNLNRVKFFEDTKVCEPLEWLSDFNLTGKKHGSLNSNSRFTKLSLNKNKRWLLQKHLKSEVEQESEVVQTDIPNSNCGMNKRKKRMVHADDCSNRKSRVAIIETPSDWMFCNKKYCKYFADSMKKESFCKSDCWRASLKVPRNIEDDVDVLYTVQTSITSKVWPHHTDGRSMNHGYYNPYYAHYKSKKTKNKVNEWDFDESDDNYESDWFDDTHDDDIGDDWFPLWSDDDDDDDDITHNIDASSRQPFTLDMLMENMNQDKFDSSYDFCEVVSEDQGDYELVNPASGQTVKKYKKGSYKTIDVPFSSIKTKCDKLVIIQTNNVMGKEMNIPSRNKKRKDNLCQELTFRISNSQLTPEYLQHSYGDNYKEGGSFPRSFAIFNRDYSLSGASILFKVNSQKNGNIYSTVLIRIFNNNLQNNVPSVNSIVDLSELVSNALSYGRKSCRKRAKQRKSFLHDKYQPQSDIMEANEIWSRSIKHHSSECNYDSFEKLCPICFSDNSVTYLKNCGHYFCNSCWESYINTKFSTGFYKLSCPQFNCDEEVDYVSIMSFLNAKDYNMYNHKSLESYVLKNSSLKFCPNDGCSKIAVNTTTEDCLQKVLCNNPIVACDCLKRWCFSCQQPDHWPSSCEAYECYQNQKQKDIGVIHDQSGKLIKVDINYRKCPFCKNAIEKNGGCNHMVCACGRSFCWACLRDYNHHETCKPVSGNTITFTSFEIGGDRIVRIQRKAVQYNYFASGMLKLKTKLKVEKKRNMCEFISPKETSLIAVAKRAFDMAIECYTLMENLTVARASCKSRHLSSRILQFIDELNLLVGILKDSLAVKELKNIKMSTVCKSMNHVVVLLEKLHIIGITKKIS